jgi:hypothetical protein
VLPGDTRLGGHAVGDQLLACAEIRNTDRERNASGCQKKRQTGTLA